ncbi:hypothetical protein M8C13_15580 [Crossiella sp. SN42]|uniref:SpvB/TcaC N-terminal domain-containing protein n=1 Tax=Crossiella sp. SN42 TaxID=2944808 RepID=UPI00207CB64B|nr:SpvB/TcaC N-terminal domain-containing protein [Crossiella sp. SN42]MCO1577179.1 hypothetical protein [Crossiella sp. SN42]
MARSVLGSTGAPRDEPSLSLPRAGGAIRGMGDKFATNPVTGTAAVSVPVALTAGRPGVAPELTLAYDSGAGNSVFGRGLDARVADPAAPARVYSWLLEETRDDRGNLVRYEYKTDGAARHLKRVRYGLRQAGAADFLFEAVHRVVVRIRSVECRTSAAGLGPGRPDRPAGR